LINCGVDLLKLTDRHAQAETFKPQEFAEGPDKCRERQEFALWAFFAVYHAYCLKTDMQV